MRWSPRALVIAIVAIAAVAAALAFLQSPPSKTAPGVWLLQSALIASGGLGFVLVCVVEGVFMQAMPQIAFALAVTLLPVFVYLKTGRTGVLAVGSMLWVFVGWWATIGSTF